jgi:hypothetical protein
LVVDMTNISPSWDLPAYVHVIFSTIVGTMYVASAVTKSKGD